MPTQYVYTLTFSDPGKTDTIVVPGTSTGPGKNNYDTSLDLVGPGYVGYGNSIAQNFVKILENFASPVPPAHGIEGQLWYDTSNPERKVLRIHNGELSSARWPSANGIYQQAVDPTAEYLQEVKDGDIWVDTAATQLKIRSGGEWTLVGPSTSSTENKSGVEVQTLESTTGDFYPVILNWVNGKVVEIISYNNFTPRLVIDGFSAVKAGVNLTNKVSSKFNGLADRALALEISRGVVIQANEVLRNRIPSSSRQIHTGTLVVESTNGFSVRRNSASPSINIYADTTNAIINFTNTNGLMKVGLDSLAYISFNNNGKIGINTTASVLLSSDPTLTVNGGARFSDSVNINASTTTNLSLSVGGRATVAGNLSVSGTLNVAGKTTVTSTLTVIDIIASTSTAVIGTTSTPFDYIFVKNLGTTGTHVRVFGSVNTATSLESSRTFRIEGVVSTTNASSFNGSQNVVFTATAHRSLITGQSAVSTTTLTQTLLVLDTSTSASSIQSISKADFLADIYSNMFVTGMMLPYTGTPATVPTGWLMCTTGTTYTDARYVKKTDYSALFSLVGLKYTNSSALADEFQLPTTSTFVTTGTNTGTTLPYIIKI